MIMLVDDSDDDRDILAAALAAANPEVRTVGFKTGEDSLAYLLADGAGVEGSEMAVRLVLLDLKMPQMDGLEVLARIRASAATARLPVVMCSSSRERHDVARCYLGGANGYLCKPVDFTALTRQMRSVVDFWVHANESWR